MRGVHFSVFGVLDYDDAEMRALDNEANAHCLARKE